MGRDARGDRRPGRHRARRGRDLPAAGSRSTDAIIRPGCTNDQGFRLTAWRIAEDADERWGSCFYFVRPRVRTQVELLTADWSDSQLVVRGRLSLDTDVAITLPSQLPLQVRVRLEVQQPAGADGQWAVAGVDASGQFAVQRNDFNGPDGAQLNVRRGSTEPFCSRHLARRCYRSPTM